MSPIYAELIYNQFLLFKNFGKQINYKGNNLYKCFPAIRYANKNDVTVAAWTVDNTVIADILVLFGAEYITTNKILP